MENRRKIFFKSTLIIVFISVLFSSRINAQIQGHVSFDLFYNELAPHGHWDHDHDYGDIWFPRLNGNFQPYGTNGYWTMTEYGNTWVSNYSWGWAPFHYGRWVHTAHRGWGWIPGYEWGPAWVDWRSGNGYYGWAPMSPSVGIHVSIGLPINLWVFAPNRRIYDRHVYRYYNHGRSNIYNRTTIINNTYIVNNNHYYGGPSRRDIERSTGRRVTVRNVRQADRPGSTRVDRNTVSIYRPENGRRNTATNNTTSRTDRGSTSSTRPSSDNRYSREMHIGKDNNSSSRDKSTRTRPVTSTNRGDNAVNRPEGTPSRTTSTRPATSTDRSGNTRNRSERTEPRTSTTRPATSTDRSSSTSNRTESTQPRSNTTRPTAPADRSSSTRNRTESTQPRSNTTRPAAPADRSSNTRPATSNRSQRSNTAPKRESQPSQSRPSRSNTSTLQSIRQNNSGSNKSVISRANSTSGRATTTSGNSRRN